MEYHVRGVAARRAAAATLMVDNISASGVRAYPISRADCVDAREQADRGSVAGRSLCVF